MRKHVRHLLAGYVHGTLSPRQRRQVARHLADCPACRAALISHEGIMRDLRDGLPAFGQPTRPQLAQMWAVIRGRLAQPGPTRLPMAGLQVLGAAFGVLITAAFSLSVLFGGTAYVAAAPPPPVPAEIRATATPIMTRAPESSRTQLHASPTAIVYNSEPIPAASPAPIARW
jgi:anti-sigma factor RsiW